MKHHSTNYKNHFISAAEDCNKTEGVIPLDTSTSKTIARLQFEILNQHPYKFTSDDILFKVYAERNDLTEPELKNAREAYFYKGQPCFRASPLTKSYGWGVHSNAEEKIAAYGIETIEYQNFIADPLIKKEKAMHSKKA